MEGAVEVARDALMITAFVFVMMLLIEYLNVLTSAEWQKRLARHRWGQYILAAALGATPGCLGAFAVVAMYSHGVVTVGAVVAAMVATSGDESFVMLAVMPKQAFLLMGVLFVGGIAAGVATDLLAVRLGSRGLLHCEGLELHAEERCDCFPRGRILRQWKECSAARGVLAVGLVIFIAGVLVGELSSHGPHAERVGLAGERWIRATLILVSAAALFIVSTVPDHFLEEHLWRHVARRHVPRIFLWTLGALAVMHLFTVYLELGERLGGGAGRWLILLAAALVGLIPQSGPHMVFVTLYARGAVPLSVLLTNAIVQEGHGMLPMLAHSRRTFLAVKATKLAVGLVVGAAAMAAGF